MFESIGLNMIPKGIAPMCYTSQYDVGRSIRVNLFSGITPYVLDGTETVTLNVRKPDNTIVTAELTNTSSSYVTFETTEQMCAVAGINKCTISVAKSGNTIASLNFFMSVQADVLSSGDPSQSVIRDLSSQVSALVDADLGENYYNKAQSDAFITDEYDAESTYAIGDMVIHENALYVCSTEITTAEAWNSAHWTLTDIATAIGKVEMAIPTKTSDLQNDSGFAQIDDSEASASKTWSSEKIGDTFSEVDSSIDTIATYSIGKNLINPKTLTNGAIQDNGTIATAGFWGNYVTTDYIALEKNTSYAFAQYFKENGQENTGRRGYLLFDKNKTIIEGSYVNNTSGPTVIATTSAVYIRLFFQNSSNGQLEKGSVQTSYEPYSFIIALNDDAPLTDRMVLGVDNEVYKVLSVNNAKMTLQIVDNDMTITSGLLKRTYKRHSNVSNKCFSFMNAFYNDVKIKGCEDDITPLRLGLTGGVFGNWTVGANHGWVALRITGTSLTLEDCGSIWTDGVRNYTLIKVGNGTAYFTYPASTDGYNTKIIAVEPVADLTHVSGATHTTNISISTASRQQLYPSISNNIVNIFADGVEITQDGTFEAYKIVVKETYNILDYVDIQNYMQSHIGANFDSVVNNIGSLLTLNIAYEIYDCGETVYTNLIANKNVLLVNCGFLQSEIIQSGSGTVYRYLNGVKAGSPFESQSLVDMTNYNTSVDITSSDMIDANKPSNRVVDVCKDNNGNILYGFTLGFIPDISDSADSKRKTLTNIWNMRNSKKTYPYCIVNENFDVNDFANVVGYRQYILPNQEITNKARIKLGNKTYYFIDAHDDYCINVADSDIGNKVTALDNTDVVYSDVISSVGLSVSSEQSYSSATLKAD